MSVNNSYANLPARLSKLGIEVPKVYSDAMSRRQWQVMPSPKGEVTALKERLQSAKTEDDYLKVQVEMADLIARINVHEELAQIMEGITAGRLPNALDDCISDIFASLSVKYAEHAIPFTEAASELPNLHQKSATVFDLSPQETQAIQEAKRLADVMSEILGVYDDVCKLKNIQTTSPLISGKDALIAVRIGDYESMAQARTAAENVSMYSGDRMGQTTLRPLAPHIAVTLAGGTLNLKAPREAVRSVEELAATSTEKPDNGAPMMTARLDPTKPEYT
jgi:hypothetical protein